MNPAGPLPIPQRKTEATEPQEGVQEGLTQGPAYAWK